MYLSTMAKQFGTGVERPVETQLIEKENCLSVQPSVIAFIMLEKNSFA